MKRPYGIINFLKRMHEEDNGVPSWMRGSLSYILLMFIPAITFGYIWTSVKSPEYVGALTITLCGFLTTALGWKFAQKKAEQNVSSDDLVKIDKNVVKEDEEKQA